MLIFELKKGCLIRQPLGTLNQPKHALVTLDIDYKKVNNVFISF